MDTQDDILSELAELADELITLPPNAFDRRAAINARQTELRQQAATLENRTRRSRDEIATELHRLEDLQGRLIADHHITDQARGGSDINAGIDGARGREELEKRIRALMEELQTAG